MTYFDILLIGIGLSMDAFAVSMCQGVCMERVRYLHALLIGLFFGCFQALMPLLGFLLGSAFAPFVTIGPWIAFAVLLVLGGKMILDGIRRTDERETLNFAGIGKLFMLAVATSIDAFAVGVTFSMQGSVKWNGGDVSVLPAVGLIGMTTLILSFSGVLLGNRFGLKYKRSATILGGMILIAIGIKILLEALGVRLFDAV